MSDFFGPFQIWRRAIGDAEFTFQKQVAGTVRSTTDTQAPGPTGFEYELRQVTNGGIVVPFNRVKLYAPGRLLWVKQFLCPSTQCSVRGVAANSSGQVYACGEFITSIDFGNGPVLSGNPGGPSFNTFLVKLDTDGSHLWHKTWGGDGLHTAKRVVLDSSGNVIVAGLFQATADFGGTIISSTNDSIGRPSQDAYVAKYSSSGALLWVKTAGSEVSDVFEGVSVDPSDNVIVTGRMDHDGTIFGSPISSIDNGKILVAKLDSSGNSLWVKAYGKSSEPGLSRVTRALTVACDTTGNVVVGGLFSNGTNLGGGDRPSGSSVLYPFLAKYESSTGNYVWDWVETSARGYIGKIVVHPTSNVIYGVGGGDSINFGVGTPGALFVTRWNSAGTVVGSYGSGSSSLIDGLLGVGIDPTSLTLGIAGLAYAGAVDFGGGWLIGNGNANLVVASFDAASANPVHRWQWRSGGGTNGVNEANDAAISSGKAFFGGDGQLTAKFDNTTTLTASGNRQYAWVACYSA